MSSACHETTTATNLTNRRTIKISDSLLTRSPLNQYSISQKDQVIESHALQSCPHRTANILSTTTTSPPPIPRTPSAPKPPPISPVRLLAIPRQHPRISVLTIHHQTQEQCQWQGRKDPRRPEQGLKEHSNQNPHSRQRVKTHNSTRLECPSHTQPCSKDSVPETATGFHSSPASHSQTPPSHPCAYHPPPNPKTTTISAKGAATLPTRPD